jgi:hypothetical protein
MSNKGRDIPVPPPCPNGVCGEHRSDGCNQLGQRYGDRYFEQLDKCDEFKLQAESCVDEDESLQLWLQALAEFPDAKCASEVAEIYRLKGNTVQFIAYAGLSYALNNRHDKSAIRFASCLYDSGDTDRSAEIVAETLNRNPDYGPAWNLLDQMGTES